MSDYCEGDFTLRLSPFWRINGRLALKESRVGSTQSALCGFGSRLYGVLNFLELGLPRHAQSVMHLQFQPEFCRGAEVSCQGVRPCRR